MIDRIVHLMAILVMNFAASGAALACACCADPGARYEYADVLSDWDFSELEQLRSDGMADVYTTACGEDCIDGITQTDDWNRTTLSVGRGGVTLTLASEESGTPSVILVADAPDQFFRHATDPTPGSRSLTPGGLYSETILPLRMQGTGPSWTGGANSFAARLILIGQSTACMELARSTHWMLDVDTEDLSFRLFGQFAPPT